VLTGVATVLADDPLLTARADGETGKCSQPLRVVLDSQLRMPGSARMLSADSAVLIVTCTADPQLPALPDHVEVAVVPADATGRCNLVAVLELLGRRGINDVWVEAGSRLAGAFLAARLIDELIVYTAPVVLGDDAIGMFAVQGFTRMEQRHEFSVDSIDTFGNDLRVVYRPVTVSRSKAP
jgi:diaminohydroxyphosphoribosylaminopyrimidine deaminase/5-amino-6-(5-phosphoribosylamino)uracil reductase